MVAAEEAAAGRQGRGVHRFQYQVLGRAFADAKGLDATTLIREVAKEIQGGGGGQKTLCVAGGRNADGLAKAMQMLKERI